MLLPQRLFHLAQPIWTFEDFARFWSIGGADNPVFLHEIDQVRGAAVSDPQSALQQRCGSLAELDHQADGIVIQLIMLIVAGAVILAGQAAGLFFLRRLEELLLVLRLRLRAPELYHAVDFLLRG